MGWFSGKEKLFIVCDIGGSRVKVLAFKASRRRREAALVDYLEKEFPRQRADDPENYLKDAAGVISEFSEKIASLEGRYPNAAMISVPHGMTVSRKVEFRTTRPDPEERLTGKELGDIWTSAKDSMLKIPEDLSESAEGWSLIAFELEQVTLDGYTLSEEHANWRGRELEFSLVLTFWRESLAEAAASAAKRCRFPTIFVPRLFLISDYLKFVEGSKVAGVLCDMSSEDCMVSVFREGGLSAFASFPFGGADITRAIAKSLKMRFHDAEILKRQWSAGTIAAGTAQKIEKALDPLFDFWKREWGLFLEHAAEHSVIRPHFFLSGGGAIIPALSAVVSDEEWHAAFATAEAAEVSRLFENPVSKQLLSNWPVHSKNDAVIFALISRMIQKYL